MREESAAALEKLKAELEVGHQVAVEQLKATWSRDKDAKIQQQVELQVASEKAAWEEELRQVGLPPLSTALLMCRGDVSCTDVLPLPCRWSRRGS